MNKEEYAAYCYGQLLQVFNATHKRQQDDKAKYRTEGLLQAGKLLGLLSRVEAAELMEKAHLKVFGQTIDGRKIYNDQVKNALNDKNSDFFNIPPHARRKTSPTAK
ncbi:MAG: hypothetical protein ACI965_001297 [Paraglaciecola sp.]|jgi:hypothetical protein